MKKNKTDEQKFKESYKDFLDNFESRFDKNKTTHCDYHTCNERVHITKFQVFTMPNMEIKVFCFEHLLATLFRFDKVKFNYIVNRSYPKTKRGAIKLYFENNYKRLN